LPSEGMVASGGTFQASDRPGVEGGAARRELGRLWVGCAALALAAVAAVLVVASGASDGRVELEERRSGYLGDKSALSTEAARKQANKLYAGNSE